MVQVLIAATTHSHGLLRAISLPSQTKLTLTTKDGSKMVGYYQETYTDENITAKIIIEFAKV